MNKKALECLYRELPVLVEAGVVTPEVADRLRAHYGELEGSSAKKWAVVLFSILGGVLIGGGIILLLAHNWEELSRPTRALISVLPLALSQLLGAWVLMTKGKSVAWREGVGAFQSLAIGAAISLVSQTYHLGGRLDDFMLTWSILALPIAYLMSATVPALLYLVGITFWTGAEGGHDTTMLWYFGLVALALPFLASVSRADRYHPRPALVGWVFAISLCIGTGIALDPICSRWNWWTIEFASIFALLYLAGARWWGDAASMWQRPLQSIGATGAVGLALILSFRFPWGRMDHWKPWIGGTGVAIGACVFGLLVLGGIILWAWALIQGDWPRVSLGAIPLVTGAGWAFAKYDAPFMAMIVFNAYLAVLGVTTLSAGLRQRRLGVVNAGMFVLAAMILCRFFDSDLGFMLRGVAFILVGIGFLGANLVLLRWKGEQKP